MTVFIVFLEIAIFAVNFPTLPEKIISFNYSWTKHNLQQHRQLHIIYIVAICYALSTLYRISKMTSPSRETFYMANLDSGVLEQQRSINSVIRNRVHGYNSLVVVQEENGTMRTLTAAENRVIELCVKWQKSGEQLV